MMTPDPYRLSAPNRYWVSWRGRAAFVERNTSKPGSTKSPSTASVSVSFLRVSDPCLQPATWPCSRQSRSSAPHTHNPGAGARATVRQRYQTAAGFQHPEEESEQCVHRGRGRRDLVHAALSRGGASSTVRGPAHVLRQRPLLMCSTTLRTSWSACDAPRKLWSAPSHGHSMCCRITLRDDDARTRGSATARNREKLARRKRA